MFLKTIGACSTRIVDQILQKAISDDKNSFFLSEWFGMTQGCHESSYGRILE